VVGELAASSPDLFELVETLTVVHVWQRDLQRVEDFELSLAREDRVVESGPALHFTRLDCFEMAGVDEDVVRCTFEVFGVFCKFRLQVEFAFSFGLPYLAGLVGRTGVDLRRVCL